MYDLFNTTLNYFQLPLDLTLIKSKKCNLGISK